LLWDIVTETRVHSLLLRFVLRYLHISYSLFSLHQFCYQIMISLSLYFNQPLSLGSAYPQHFVPW
jgi:hypothetical protein